MKRANLAWKIALVAFLTLALSPSARAQPGGPVAGPVAQPGDDVRDPSPDECLALAVTQSTDRGLIELSPGSGVSARDLAKFTARWMQRDGEGGQKEFLAVMRYELYRQTADKMSWDVSWRAEAMVRMFDLTGDLRYVAHLRDLAQTALKYRDDFHQGPIPGDGLAPHERPRKTPQDGFLVSPRPLGGTGA